MLACRRGAPGLTKGFGYQPEEGVMRAPLITHRPQESAPAPHRSVGSVLQPVGRFAMHFFEMCMVMCLGAISLSLLVFGAAALLGYTDLPQRAPELTVLIIAINLSLPMAAWMRFRGMAWRPTLEMSGSTMVAGLLLIAAYWLGIIAQSSLMGLQTGLLACPLMLAVMLVRFPLYSTSHKRHHAHAAP
jgi:hypothetical protein